MKPRKNSDNVIHFPRKKHQDKPFLNATEIEKLCYYAFGFSWGMLTMRIVTKLKNQS